MNSEIIDYKVNLVSEDLRHEEFILNLCNSLQKLNSLSENVFFKIENKINEKSCRLDEFNRRVDIAQDKIEQMRGLSKATRVFSHSKYSDQAVHLLQLSLFPVNHQSTARGEKKKVVIKEKHQLITLDELLNKKKSMSRFLSSQSKMIKSGANAQNVSSVCSLLLFNSLHNLYNAQDENDVGASLQTTRKQNQQSNDEDSLGLAPPSIGRMESETMGRDELAYIPTMGDVPSFTLPDFLPQLIGVADDISFSSDHPDSSIAPSLLYLPNILSQEQFLTNKIPITSTLSLPPSPPVNNTDNTPPPSSLSFSQPTSTTQPAYVPSISPSVPPPPPPPPSTQQPLPPSSPPQMPLETDGRSSLMAAIRNAGGASKAKLKSVKDEKRKNSKKKIESGDLMSDLAAKLSMRRKGIRGQQDTQSPLQMMLDRMSSITVDPAVEEEEDEDWD